MKIKIKREVTIRDDENKCAVAFYIYPVGEDDSEHIWVHLLFRDLMEHTKSYEYEILRLRKKIGKPILEKEYPLLLKKVIEKLSKKDIEKIKKILELYEREGLNSSEMKFFVREGTRLFEKILPLIFKIELNSIFNWIYPDYEKTLIIKKKGEKMKKFRLVEEIFDGFGYRKDILAEGSWEEIMKAFNNLVENIGNRWFPYGIGDETNPETYRDFYIDYDPNPTIYENGRGMDRVEIEEIPPCEEDGELCNLLEEE